jgi:serine/threonine protein kinase
MWSIGIICYTLVCGELHDFSEKPVTFDNPVWNSISHECKDFITDCLQVDPEKRIDSVTGAKHMWFLR